MLRLLVLVLLVANLAYFAWSRGHLAGIVPVAADQREPQRLQQQVRPDAIRILPPGTRPAAEPSTAAMPGLPASAASAP